MTAITTPLGLPTTNPFSRLGALFTNAFSHVFVAHDVAPRRPRPARSHSYYESGLAGRERFRL